MSSHSDAADANSGGRWTLVGTLLLLAGLLVASVAHAVAGTLLLFAGTGVMLYEWFGFAGERAAPSDGSETPAFDALRKRYAEGEIDEAEFERRVEGLLETEGADAGVEAPEDAEEVERN